MQRFTSEWALAWMEALNQSDAYRKAARKWKWPVVLRIESKVDWWLDLDRGRCKDIRQATPDELLKTDIILAASEKDWGRILSGEVAPIVAIMQGVITLERGSLLKLSRHAQAATEMLQAAISLEKAEVQPQEEMKAKPSLGAVAQISDADQAFRTTSAGGLDQDSLPMQLFQKAKKLGVWDPMDIDFQKDRADWQRLTEDEQDILVRLLAMFQAGEEAVTLDLLPLMRVIAKEGRIEEEMYLTTFLFEEAKHVELFSRIFKEVVVRTDDLSGYHSASYRALFYEALPTAMNRLDADSSPAAQLTASATYNMVVEGTLAETGYHAFYSVLESRGIMPGVTEGIRLLQRDESRHIAYGVHLITRLIRENPELSPLFHQVMGELIPVATATISEIFSQYDPVPFGLREEDFLRFAMDQFGKRMRRIESGASGAPVQSASE